MRRREQTTGGGFVLRQQRLRTGFAQIFLAVFSLLATFAPALDGLPLGSESEVSVSMPADPRGEGTNLVRATLGFAEELEEEADEPEGSHLLALHCAAQHIGRVAEASEARAQPRYWRFAQLHTGPPTL